MSAEKKSRTYNFVANSAIGVVAAILQVLLNYVVKIVIVRELGDEINGLHYLFNSIASVMMLMEAGFETAVVVHLYKPLDKNDEHMVIMLMSYYKKIYTIIGTLFMAICIFIDVFAIEALVETTISYSRVRLYFLLFMMTYVVNFFTCYKKSILFADQKNRVSVGITILCEIIFRTIDIILIFVLHKYVVVVILLILEKIAINYSCARYVDKNYPYLKNHKYIKIEETLKKGIFKTVKPLFVYNLTSTMQESSKSILISMLLGNVKVVGYYGNYGLVVSAAKILYTQIGGAFTSMVGNIAVDNKPEDLYHAYKKIAFLTDWLAILFCAGLVACIQDFIMFAFGKEYILSYAFVIVLTFETFAYFLNVPIVSIQNALGLHGKDVNYMVVQMFCAIILEFIGGKLFGMLGILIGAIIPQVIFTLIHKGIVINVSAFAKKPSEHLKFLLAENLKCILVIALTCAAVSFIHIDSVVLDFIAKGFTAVGVWFAVFIALSFKNVYFREIVSRFKRI